MQKKCNDIANDPCTLDEAKALLSQLKSMNLRQEDIQSATKIHQTQISRLMAGDFKRVKGNALKLCKYAKKIQTARKPLATHDMERKIVEHALYLWDRSEDSGHRLLELLLALRDFADR
jgi:predicted XRE-type DNA-binding protein